MKVLLCFLLINLFCAQFGFGMNSRKCFGRLHESLACCGKGRLTKRKHKQPLTDKLLTSRLSALAKSKNKSAVKSALSLVKGAERMGIEPNLFTFSALINVCAKHDQWREGLKILELMKERGIEPNQIAYSPLVDACIDEDSLFDAIEIFYYSMRHGVELDEVRYHKLVHACCGNSQKKKAGAILEQEQKGERISKLSMYNLILSRYAMEGKYLEAEAVYSQMERVKLIPDEASHNYLIAACVNGQDFSRAIKWLRSAMDNDVYRQDLLAGHLLNFHLGAIYSGSVMDRLRSENRIDMTHVPCVPRAVAIAILHMRLEEGDDSFPAQIVVGRRGKGIIRATVMNFLKENGILYRENEQNDGRIDVLLKPHR